MIDERPRVKKYFDLKSTQFDAIYSQDSGRFMNFINRKLRWEIKERVDVTFNKLCDSDINTVLDIGCGTGRLCLALAKCGKNVWGIDFSPKMIEKAEYLKNQNKMDKVKFLCADFFEYNFNKTFDASIALGLFDYTRKPIEFLEKVSKVTDKIFIASFPTKKTLRSIFRKIRLSLYNCPVYFYTPNQIEEYLKKAKFKVVDFRTIGNTYLAESRKI